MADIYQSPRLQLGDAPLTGYAGSQRDQFALLWQTTGALSDDVFEVSYRPVGSNTWQTAAPPTTIDTGVGSRINHTVTIKEVDYNTAYEYRVRHRQGGAVVETFQQQFRTRLAVGSRDDFTFVAYGDAAKSSFINNFRRVQSRINQVDPAFSLLLGDNAYNDGSHDDYDYRFVSDLVPEATDNIAQRIDFSAIGNHDVDTAGGLPYRDNYAFPVPEAGVDSPAAPDGVEPEHNYSFDYGNTHFVTFDSNTLESAADLDNVLDYVEADLVASDAQWKIVYAHHPVAGGPDKPESPSDNYYRQVVPRLKAAGVDLLLTGHSHTFSWTYPLTGVSGGNATFIEDTDKVYDKGVGLVQAVIGVGGSRLRSGDFNYPFVASGYSQSTDRRVEHGFAQVSVSENALTVDYVAADDGEVIDSFQIVDASAEPPAEPPVAPPAEPPVAPPANRLLFSLKSQTSLGGAVYRNEDIVAYDGEAFSKLFDGSDVGLKRLNIDAMDRLSDTEFLMSFTAATQLTMNGNVVSVDDSDIVKFTATSLGENTAGEFEMYLDGSTVGLTANSQDIDALSVLENGDLLLSTTGNYKVGSLRIRDEDLVQVTPDPLGHSTQGDWTLYFDGSDVGLGARVDDIDAVALGSSTGLPTDLALSTFHSNAFSGASESILNFSASNLGANTAGTLDAQLIFDSLSLGVRENLINALDIN